MHHECFDIHDKHLRSTHSQHSYSELLRSRGVRQPEMYLVVCDHQVYHLVPVFASSAAHSIIFRENLLEILRILLLLTLKYLTESHRSRIE